jgi:hypothetical protein
MAIARPACEARMSVPACQKDGPASATLICPPSAKWPCGTVDVEDHLNLLERSKMGTEAILKPAYRVGR